ncbi:biotin--[acetyl-CoA-carboxylase] ligase [Marinobacter zhanjiangensis]|uniref:Bifunctional ligase/repressor BirA n=1 Tax=Marinobacter zhanjiangensis TaxID=578215 RepID=A0ABQ3B523_9GAMM|nr:biotin--[acetyl-CoA-carboxylase] ligase [Marinobacter zhanjiangensis]GGY77541.1 bifunctional ligase/repressor BirA [Marinobacter zhanjiangensis]
MNTRPLLKLLADGAIHSGEYLAESLGISRTAIWKQVRKLQSDGIHVDTIRGRGYQLAAPMDLLSAEGVREGLQGELGGRMSLEVHDRIDSTNSQIARRWQQGETGLLVTIADCQEQGRGRRGRPWQSPVGQNLYMSVGVTIARGFTQLEGLSLVGGIAMIESLALPEGVKAGLKWPNDLLLDNRKLAGILIELQGELEGAVRVILGVGLNVHMTEAASVDQPWTSLALAAPGRPWRRNQLAADILDQLVARLDAFEQSGFAPFCDLWNEYDLFRGQTLRATSGDLYGQGLGVDDAGNYLLQTERGLQKINAGEISLRVAS